MKNQIALISVHGDPATQTGIEEAGGQCVYVREIGEELAKLGFQVDMFTRKIRAGEPEIVQHSSKCRTIRLLAGPEKFIPRDEIYGYMPQFLESLKKFQLKEGINYSLVHTNYWLSGWVGLQLKKLCGVKLIHTYLSLGAVKYKVTCSRPLISEIRLDIEKQILEYSDYVIANSPQEVKDLRELVSHKGKIKIIPLGTDTNLFRYIDKANARRKLGLEVTKQIVLYVGRFDPRKGIETAVRACAQSKALSKNNLKLVIVGGSSPERLDRTEQKRIEKIVQELGLVEHTIFAGRVDHENLPLYYASANVCVVPSHYEPFGLVAIEAMACGTPVIASRVGGLKFTVVSKQTGLLVPPQNTTAFTNAIDRILEDWSWSEKLGKNAIDRVNNYFSLQEIAIRLSTLYREFPY